MGTVRGRIRAVLESCTNCIEQCDLTALDGKPCRRLPLVSKGKTKQQKRGNANAGEFPQHCLFSWKWTRKIRDLSIFSYHSCGATGGETSFLCRTSWQWRLCLFCFHSVFCRNLKKKRVQWSLNRPTVSESVVCIIYYTSPQLVWISPLTMTLAVDLLHYVLHLGSGAVPS